MSGQPVHLNPARIEQLKRDLLNMDENSLTMAYLEFKKYNNSSGSRSKEERELGMAYLGALTEKQEQRERLEESQRQ